MSMNDGKCPRPCLHSTRHCSVGSHSLSWDNVRGFTFFSPPPSNWWAVREGERWWLWRRRPTVNNCAARSVCFSISLHFAQTLALDVDHENGIILHSFFTMDLHPRQRVCSPCVYSIWGKKRNDSNMNISRKLLCDMLRGSQGVGIINYAQSVN